MEIKSGKFVVAKYDLYVGEDDDRELMEEATEETPLTFIYGVGQMLESFEAKLNGMKAGDSFDFILPAEEAYGERDEDHMLELGKDMFEVDGEFDAEMIFEGNVVPMMDANGNRLNGAVLEVREDVVVMDFNHPLAGEDLHFIGVVLEVREPTADELNPPSGCGGCNCDGDDCESGCGSKGCNC